MHPPGDATRLPPAGTRIGIALAMPILGLCCLGPGDAWAQEQSDDPKAVPQRPTIRFNRWQEDWSVLADPRVPAEPLDFLKYIPLSGTDPQTYLSLGANIRERYEHNDAATFGTGGNSDQDCIISRTTCASARMWRCSRRCRATSRPASRSSPPWTATGSIWSRPSSS